MRRVLLGIVLLMSVFAAKAQLPIVYYDFESNANRNNLENVADLRVNTIANEAFTKVGSTTTIGNAFGFGTLNGGTADGSAIFGRNWQNTNTDPGINANRYLEFSFSTVGFSNNSFYAQILTSRANGSTNSPNYGLLISTDNGANYTSLLTGQASSNAGNLFIPDVTLPAAADNNPNCRIRIYGYKTSSNSDNSFIIVDNVQILSKSTIAGKVFTTLDERQIFTGFTSGLTGNFYATNQFTATGAGTVVNMGEESFLSSTTLAGFLNVTNGAIVNTTSTLRINSIIGVNSPTVSSLNINTNGRLNQTGTGLQIVTNGITTVDNTGTLNANTNTVTGTGSFIVNNGGTLITANTGGVVATILPTTRTFNTGARYEFNSTVANQSTGFTGITLNNPSNILVSNTGGTVSLDANVTFTNNANLTVNSGSILNANTRTFAYGTGGTAAINGSFLTENTNGFSGGAATSIINSNTPTVSLGAASTVNYTATSGNQNITNAVAYQNLTLSGTGTKTAPAGTITILGNYNKATAAANFVHNNGSVLFAGTAAQAYTSTGASTFYDITNNNAVNLNINNDTLNVVNTLNMGNNAKLNLLAGNICLKSSNTATANVTAIPASADITYNGTGRFVIERYLFAKKSWRSLATPIDPSDPTTVTQAWRENGSALTSTGFGTQITGPSTTGGFDQNTIRGSLKSYNMALGDFVDVTNTGNTIYNASGYFVFVRGDRAVNTTGTTGATTLRMSGKIVRNDQAYTITANKFISIGNPYASRVDVRNLTFGGGAVQSFYVWNPNAPGSYNVGGYQVYVKEIAGTNYRLNGLPLGAINNFIESGQAVFFQANGSAGTVTFTEASKASGSSLVSRMGSTERPGATTPSLAINLKTTDVDGTQFDADGIVVDFDANFTNTIDENDVRKVSNTVDNLSMRSNGVLLTADRRGLLRNNDTIFLNIAGLRTANYSFSIDPSLIDGLGLEAFLVDAFLGTQTPVSLTDVTAINFATTTDAASKANTRFMLVFKPAAVLPVTFTTITAVRDAINKQVAVRWNVATEINITRYEVERSATGIGFAPIAIVNPISNNGVAVSYSINDAAALATTNFYRVKAISNNGTVQYSAVVKVAALPTVSGFVVYPNPVVGNTINLQANQVTKGAYNVQLVNQAGQIVYKGLLNINSDNQSTSLVLDAATAAGVYTLVLDNDQQKVSLQVLVR